MKRLMPVLKVELFALSMLALCALAFGVYGTLTHEFPYETSATIYETLSRVLILAAIFFAFGFLPVALCGAPAYVGLYKLGRANWGSIILVGCLPGLVVLPLEGSLGLYALLGGLVVYPHTHSRLK